MQKRFELDSEYILKGDKSIASVRAWTDELFCRAEFAEMIILEEVKKWFLEVVFCAYEKAQNDLEKRMMLVKIIHTLEVVAAGFEIASAEKQVSWNQNQVGTVCMLHDIARFDQALLGSFSDEETGLDHAVVGSEMIKNHYFEDFEKNGIGKDSVIESVKNHSAFSYSGQDFYAKLTRDADKLAILRALPEILAARVGDFDEGTVSEGALKSFKGGEMVHHRDMKTKTDHLLACISWENDFNFSKTKRLYVEEGIKEWMMKDIASVLGTEIV